MSDECALCKPELFGEKIYDDANCYIIECPRCSAMVAISQHHGVRETLIMRAEMTNRLMRIANERYGRKNFTIRLEFHHGWNHWHAHADLI
jgi:hypothetical protein